MNTFIILHSYDTQYQPSASETFATSILQSEGESEGMAEEESEESTALSKEWL